MSIKEATWHKCTYSVKFSLSAFPVPFQRVSVEPMKTYGERNVKQIILLNQIEMMRCGLTTQITLGLPKKLVHRLNSPNLATSILGINKYPR